MNYFKPARTVNSFAMAYLVELNHVRMANLLKNLNFTCDALNVLLVVNLVFFKDFYCYLLSITTKFSNWIIRSDLKRKNLLIFAEKQKLVISRFSGSLRFRACVWFYLIATLTFSPVSTWVPCLTCPKVPFPSALPTYQKLLVRQWNYHARAGYACHHRGNREREPVKNVNLTKDVVANSDISSGVDLGSRQCCRVWHIMVLLVVCVSIMIKMTLGAIEYTLFAPN